MLRRGASLGSSLDKEWGVADFALSLVALVALAEDNEEEEAVDVGGGGLPLDDAALVERRMGDGIVAERGTFRSVVG